MGTRYIWDKSKGRLVEAANFRFGPPGPQIMRDQAGFRSPIDGSWVEGRAAVREHERRHDVRQVGTDIKPPE